jgi:hypothetical protein
LAPTNTFIASAGLVRGPFDLLPDFNFNLFSSNYPEQERWGGYAAFSDKICGDQVVIFGDFYYDDVKQHDELAPIARGSFVLPGAPTLAIPPHSNLNGVAPPNTPRFAGQPAGTDIGEDQTNTPVDAFNPFNPFNQIISGGTRARIFDFGNRLIDTENEAQLATIGVKGDNVFNSAAKTHEVSGRTNNDPFLFLGSVAVGDGFLKWKGISRLTWDWNNFSLTTAPRYFDGFREQRANHVFKRGTNIDVDGDGVVDGPPDIPGVLVENGGVIEHWIRPVWFWDGQLSYNLVFTQPVEQHPVAGYSKDSKEVKSGKNKEVVEQALGMPCWKTLLNNTTYTIGCNNMLGADPPKAFGTFKGNGQNYPGALYDNLGRFWYVELIKRF